MRRSKRRLFLFIVGIVFSMLVLDLIERKRSIRTPSGWNRVTGPELPLPAQSWNLSTSVWRVGENTTWTSHTQHDQVYVRADLEPTSKVGLSVSRYNDAPLWIWLDEEGAVSAVHGGKTISCMGKIPSNAKPAALELKLDPDGLMVSRHNNKMICPIDAGDRVPPQLQVQGGSANILSIGRDRRADGVPLSPLWWMSGLMGLCFLWMVTMDLIVGLIQGIQHRKAASTTSLEE